MKKDYLSLFTELPGSLGISEYRMEFADSELEEAYIADSEEHYISRKRAGLLVGVILFLVLGAVDFLLFPKVKGLVWFIRFAIIIPLLLLTFSMSYMDKYKSKVRGFIPILVVLIALGHLVSLKFMPFSATAAFYSGYLLLIIYSIIFMRSGFVNGLVDMVLIGIFYAVFVLLNDNIEYMDKIVGGILVVSACFIGILYTYFSEYYDRKNYMLSRQLNPAEGEYSLSDYSFEEAIIFIDKDGICKYISKQMENLIPYSKDSIINGPVSKIFSKKDRKRFERSVKVEHSEDMLLEDSFEVLNKSNVGVPLNLTVSDHVDHRFGEGYIMILSNPELEYSSAKLLSDTKQLLRDKKQEEAKAPKEAREPIAAKQNPEKEVAKSLLDSGEEGSVREAPEESKAPMPSLNLREAGKEEASAFEAEKLKRLESQVHELRMKNEALYRDAEDLRKENRVLKDNKTREIEENSFDSIKLMGRMASFVSSSLAKNFGENINYLNENEGAFRDAPYKNYIGIIKNRVYEGMYLSGAIALKFELFEQYLKPEREKTKGIEVARALGTSLSQMAKYFEGTAHIVEVSCKDDITIRMNEESFKYILQNIVMNSLISAIQLGKDALIEMSVKEEKSKVIIEYSDNGKVFPSYYKEIVKLKEIDSNVLSVNGIEFFFAKDLIKRECSGEFALSQGRDGNKVRMIFMK